MALRQTYQSSSEFQVLRPRIPIDEAGQPLLEQRFQGVSPARARKRRDCTRAGNGEDSSNWRRTDGRRQLNVRIPEQDEFLLGALSSQTTLHSRSWRLASR